MDREEVVVLGDSHAGVRVLSFPIPIRQLLPTGLPFRYYFIRVNNPVNKLLINGVLVKKRLNELGFLSDLKASFKQLNQNLESYLFNGRNFLQHLVEQLLLFCEVLDDSRSGVL